MTIDRYALLGEKKYRKGFDGIDFGEVASVTVRYHVLVATGHKDDKDTGGNALRSKWAKGRQKIDLEEPPGLLAPPLIEISQLPLGSFFIQFTFTLAKPYLSKDDNPFYIIDNPIVRDKVFRYPMVRPTSWKGNLYSALWQSGHDKKNEENMQRLFGDVRNEDGGQAGRLYFYPTFFTQTSLEIINPHDRKRRVGKNPIYLECVPPDATGTFTLLYVPFDRIGQPEEQTRQQAFADLQRVAEGLQAMFLTYGFSAKRTSGFGVAKDEIDGLIKTRADEKKLTRLRQLAQEVKNVGF